MNAIMPRPRGASVAPLSIRHDDKDALRPERLHLAPIPGRGACQEGDIQLELAQGRHLFCRIGRSEGELDIGVGRTECANEIGEEPRGERGEDTDPESAFERLGA